MEDLKVQLLNYQEKKQIEGGSILKDIQDGIRAINRIKDFFSGRPQV